MENKNQIQLDMDTVAKWMGWDKINFNMLQEKMNELVQENQRLNQLLAEAKLGKE